MKKVLKKIIKNIQNLNETILWLARILYYENFKNYIPKEEKSKKLVLLANGPSLKKDFKIENYNPETDDLRVVNFFWKDKEIYDLKPSSLVLADPFFFHEPLDQKHKENIEVINRIDWEITLFVPFNYYKVSKKLIINPKVKIIPFHKFDYKGWKSVKNFLYKNGLSMPRAQNVAIPSIFIGINEGYKTIELYGMDHSWTEDIRVNEKNQVCIKHRHTYDTKEPILIPWFHLNGPYSMKKILRDLALMFEGYEILQDYSEKLNCKILNKTKDSYVDAFDRN